MAPFRKSGRKKNPPIQKSASVDVLYPTEPTKQIDIPYVIIETQKQENDVPKRDSIIVSKRDSKRNPSTVSKQEEVVEVAKEKKHTVSDTEVEYVERSRLNLESFVTSYVGYDNLPNQIFRRAVRHGFSFNLMVVGRSGLGKSTFINSFFANELYDEKTRESFKRTAYIEKTVTLEEHKFALLENGVKLELSVIDTPGFGDKVDNTPHNWDNIIHYIDTQMERYLTAESQFLREKTRDTRVHCVLYFIPSSTHGLKPLDLEFLHLLQYKVNIILLIAKADTLTESEKHSLKIRINADIKKFNIKIYDFPNCSEIEDEELAINEEHRLKTPFAVCGSTETIDTSRGIKNVRQYPWGYVELDNPVHCDNTVLRTLMLRYHLQHMKDTQAGDHYREYRSFRLASVDITKPTSASTENLKDDRSHSVAYTNTHIIDEETRRKYQDERLEQLEADYDVLLAQTFLEMEEELREREDEYEKLKNEIKEEIVNLRAELDDKKWKFEKAKEDWEDQKFIAIYGERNREKAPPLAQSP